MNELIYLTQSLVREPDPEIYHACVIMNDENASSLNLNATINTINSCGYTPLMIAALYGKINICKRLLAAGANVNITAPTRYNSTALMVAATNSRIISTLAMVQFLIDQGANVNEQSRTGYTALILSAYSSCSTSSIETVKLLLDNGADIHAANSNGETALTCTVMNFNNSSLKTMKLLIHRGANLTVLSTNGNTLLDHAMTMTATFAGYSIDWARPWILVCVFEPTTRSHRPMLPILVRLKGLL